MERKFLTFGDGKPNVTQLYTIESRDCCYRVLTVCLGKG